MNRKGHISFTLLFTAIAIYVLNRFYVGLPHIIMAVGLAEAILITALPDSFEPGGRSDHRKGFHSWRVLAACLLICGLGLYLMPTDLWFYHAIFFVSWGYATHLMADALTPAGLPF